MKAAMLRHMEDKSNKEISREIGVTESTVENYFCDPEMQQFKRFYSDQQLFRLQQSLEQDVKDGDQLANNLLARAIQHDDASANTLVRASKLALENRKRKIELLQELGVLEKQADKVEDVSGGPAEVSVSFEEVEGDGDVEELSAE